MISLAWVAPAVAALRLLELRLCRRNRLRLLARGGREVRPDTYKTMVVLHVLFLASLSLESYPWRVPAGIRTWACLAALAVVTALRYWAIASLGEYWNTRVVVVPGTRLVRAGPYRFLRHPNYLVIVLEFLLLPLLMRAPVTLVLFSLANLAALRQRIRIEETALAEIVRHRLLLWLFLPIGLIAGWGCAQKLPVDEGRMVIALPGAPVNVDPRVATDAYGEQILQMTHASLVRSDAGGVVGVDDRRGPALPVHRAAPRDGPRGGDPPHRHGVQLPGGRPARRPRSQVKDQPDSSLSDSSFDTKYVPWNHTCKVWMNGRPA